VAVLSEELASRGGFGRIVGTSKIWLDVLVQAAKVAPMETTVLLTGESGTGKEVVARAIHRSSARAAGAFIALNCAALPDQLLESELFGYEKGAFTGAMAAKPGRIEQAAGGTLFLDEAGEMSPAVQAKLLRVLEEREFQRLGGTRVLRTDARIVAATNRDLARAIEKGEFREDLFYRLSVFGIHLPPLRERPEDILPLTEMFLAELGPAVGRPVPGVSREAKELLLSYPWPGNVRELRNALERAAILVEGGLITAAHLPISVTRQDSAARGAAPGAAGAFLPPEGVDLESLERDYVKEALKKARFNKSRAAKLLGLTRAQLYSRIEKYGLEGQANES
jgi:transcriptional regulator with PAS, ATPase and Fis domain